MPQPLRRSGDCRQLQRLGLRLQDVKLIGASHEHFDHVGGIASCSAAGCAGEGPSSGFKPLETGVVNRQTRNRGCIRPFGRQGANYFPTAS